MRTDAREVNEAMFDWPYGDERLGPLAGMTATPDGSQIYLQYRRHCDRKQEFAVLLMDFWRSEGIDLPRFQRLPEPIEPSPGTIDIQGPDWRDPTPLTPERDPNEQRGT